MRDLRDEIAFFEEIRVWMAKADANRGQQLSPALTSDELAFMTRSRRTSRPSRRWPRRPRRHSPGSGQVARRDVTTDWVSRDDVRAKLRSIIKRLLARYGYPPGATELVLHQMETFAEEWSPEAGW